MILLLFLLLVQANTEVNQEADRLLLLGNQLFADGDYAGAVAAYNGVIAEGYENGAVHANLGGAYYQTGRTGLAVYHYERAARLAPGDEAVGQSLLFIREEAGLEFATVPERPWEAGLRWLEERVGVGLLLVTGWLLYVLAISLAGLWLWRRSSRGARIGWLRRATIAAAVLAALVLVPALGLWREAQAVRAVVVSTAPLRAAPRPQAERTATLSEGRLVRLIAQRDGWQQVELPDGTTGWVEAGVARTV